MSLLGRIIVIVFALVVALFAAGTAFAIVLLGPQWHGLSGGAAERGIFWSTAFLGSVITGTAVLLPSAVLIALAEAFTIRSLLVHLLVGAAMPTLIVASSYVESVNHQPVWPAMKIAVTLGAVFGFAYWALAGRNAGRWRERRLPSA